jgi:hypothetical protein
MRRQDLGMIFVMMSGLTLGLVGTGTNVKPLVLVGCLLAGAVAAIGMVRTHRQGVIRTNRGATRRAEDPVGYWIASVFWWAVILLWTLGGMLHGFGVLVRE